MASWKLTMYRRDQFNHLVQKCGSTNNLEIDGRLKLDNALAIAYREAEQSAKKESDIVGFKLYRAERWLTEQAVRLQPLHKVTT